MKIKVMSILVKTSPTTPVYAQDQFDLQPPGIRIGPNTELLHHAEHDVVLAEPEICPSEDIGILSVTPNGDTRKVVGIFQLPDDELRAVAIVVLTEASSGAQSLFLGGLHADESGELLYQNNFVEIETGVPLTIGRTGDKSNDTGVVGAAELWGKGETFGPQVSKQHVTIKYQNGHVKIIDASLNGTEIVPHQLVVVYDEPVPDNDFGHMAGHTFNARELARLHGLASKAFDKEVELFAGREDIDRNTTDPEGKVDIRSWGAGGEAIVVDSKKAPEAFQKLLTACESRLAQYAVLTEREIIKAVYDTIASGIKYDLGYANQMSAGLKSQHRKVNLGNYINAGKGVCRHMALATQWLGVRITEKYPKMFEGTSFTVPVNQRTSDNSAHEWARYNGRNGEVYILDPAQRFFGTLREVLQDERMGKKRWEYFKDDNERRKYESLAMGALGTKQQFFWRRPG